MTRVNKGIRFEYKIRDQLRKEGYYVVRSAGSHGDFDLVAINPTTNIIKLLQLKRGSKRYIKSSKERYDCKHFEGEYMVKFEIIEKED